MAQQLEADLRRVMEPNTASRLQERKRNKLKDFIAMAGPLGVSHLILLSQTDSTTNLRLGKFPQGPTLYFRILSFSLMKEVTGLQRKPRSPSSEYRTAPLLVLNNMPLESSHGKLLCSMLQNMFPSINTSKVRLSEVRRVVLFNYDAQEDAIEMRHYFINVKATGLSKSVKRIIRAEIPNLSNFADAAEYVLKAEVNLSESEMEPDSLITLGPDHPTPEYATKSQQRSVQLVECGPRITMRLVKVTEGLNTGKVLYHALAENSPAEEAGEDEDVQGGEGLELDDSDEKTKESRKRTVRVMGKQKTEKRTEKRQGRGDRRMRPKKQNP